MRERRTNVVREANATDPSSWLHALYEWKTPLFDRYYRAVRKRIRFPRYYKRSLNW